MIWRIRLHEYSESGNAENVEYSEKYNSIDMIAQWSIPPLWLSVWRGRMSKNSRIESLHKGDQGCTLDGFIGLFIMTWMWIKWGRRKSLIFHHGSRPFFVIPSQSTNFTSTTPQQLCDAMAKYKMLLLLGADSSVSQDTSHVWTEIHKFAMSNKC